MTGTTYLELGPELGDIGGSHAVMSRAGRRAVKITSILCCEYSSVCIVSCIERQLLLAGDATVPVTIHYRFFIGPDVGITIRKLPTAFSPNRLSAGPPSFSLLTLDFLSLSLSLSLLFTYTSLFFSPSFTVVGHRSGYQLSCQCVAYRPVRSIVAYPSRTPTPLLLRTESFPCAIMASEQPGQAAAGGALGDRISKPQDSKPGVFTPWTMF